MLRKIARGVGVVVVTLLLAVVVAYLFGVRVEMDGGGSPHLAVPLSDAARAEQIARHRDAQRAAAAAAPVPAAPVLSAPVAAPEPVSSAPSTASQPPVAEAPAVPAPTASPYWTDFRGPRRDGHYTERSIRTNWPSAGLTPVWKQPAGGGYASFVIARGRAFTIEQRGGEEVAAAYDVATGRELWTNAWTAAFRELMGGDGPRATPTWSDGLVYVLGATGELRCLDEDTGKPVWRTNILTDAGATNLQWGMAASPLIVDHTVVVQPGGANGQSFVAYDRRTGKRAWAALDDRQAYASPMLVTVAGVRQILAFTATRLMGLSPDRATCSGSSPGRRSTT